MKFRYILLVLIVAGGYVYYRDYYAPSKNTQETSAETEVDSKADNKAADDKEEPVVTSEYENVESNTKDLRCITTPSEEDLSYLDGLTLPGIEDPEILIAYKFLNEMRSNPPAYSEMVNFDLSNVEARPALNWDTTLAAVAQAKAEDQARRNYFAHVNPEGYAINFYINHAGYKLEDDWLVERSINNFESLGAGYVKGKKVVVELVNDDGIPTGEPGSGHRMHLLGIEDWNAKMKDVGIGHAYNRETKYGHYWVFLIARHSW